MNATKDDLEKMPPHSCVNMACRKCESLEDHIKLLDGKWECQWCGHKE